jgi:hypothetical protein
MLDATRLLSEMRRLPDRLISRLPNSCAEPRPMFIPPSV